MKKTLLIIFSLAVLSNFLFAQKFITKNGFIQFYSKAQMEEIKADNKQVSSALDIKTGDFVFNNLIPGTQGQVWSLNMIDSTLYCCHNNGTLIYEDNTFKKIGDIGGGAFNIQKINVNNSEYLLQSKLYSLHH